MLWLNPSDNQGVRLLIGEVDPWRGKTAEISNVDPLPLVFFESPFAPVWAFLSARLCRLNCRVQHTKGSSPAIGGSKSREKFRD